MKLFGILIMALVPTLWGIIRGEKIRKEYRLFVSLCELIKYTGFEVKNHSKRQKDIFSSFTDKLLEETGFLGRLRFLSETKPEKALYTAISENISDFGLEKKDADEILGFAKTFGSFSLERQISECDGAIRFTEELKKDKKKKTDDKIKLARTIGISAGAGLLIMLL